MWERFARPDTNRLRTTVRALLQRLELRDEVVEKFDVPVLTVCNKSDESRDVDADHYMSITEGEGVDAVLEAAVDAVDWELELPFEEN